MNILKARPLAALALALFSLVAAGCVQSDAVFNDAPKSTPYAVLVPTSAQSYFQRGPLITHINSLPAPASRPEYRLTPGTNVITLKAAESYYAYGALTFTAAAGRRYEVGYKGGRTSAVLFDITDSANGHVVASSSRRDAGGE